MSKDPKKTMRKIVSNYKAIEESLVNQLEIQTPEQPYVTGSYRETVWKSLFEMIIPKKYCIEQGIFIIDSYENISREVDLVVFDEMYTPYIFNYGKIKFIPVEAVAIVIQCKSIIDESEDEIQKNEQERKNKKEKGISFTKKEYDMYFNLKEWSDSVKALKTSLDSVARIVSGICDNQSQDKPLTQTSTRPVSILCATKIKGCEESLKKMFDVLLFVDNKALKKVIVGEECENIITWYEKLDHDGVGDQKDEPTDDMAENAPKFEADDLAYRKNHMNVIKEDNLEKRKLNQLKVTNVDGTENVIMSLTFQLNQLLMLINNPMLFPHRAYAQRFSEILKQPAGKEASDKNE